MQEIIVIVGPTGVGKTKLSISLAKKLNAEIINGDSVSIYKRLDIGSAKPTTLEREGIKHHLIDIRDVCEEYSVFDYQRDVRNLINKLSGENKRIIIVGGTGLYIKAALYDYKFSECNLENETYDELSNEEILEKIKKYDIDELPHVNNRKRLIRLLNKLEHNEIITYDKDKLLYDIKVIGLTTERDYLYERINKRVDSMMNNGLIDEINSLKDFYKDSRILNSGIGYKEFSDYLFNNQSLEKTIEKIKQDSRRYAKRQYTFFNNQFDTKWFNVNFEDFNKTIDEVIDFIK